MANEHAAQGADAADLRAALSSAIDSAAAPKVEAVEPAAIPAKVETPEPKPAPVAAETAKPEKPEAKVEVKPETPAATSEAKPTEPSKDQKAVQDAKTLEGHASWSEADKAAFRKFPPEAQAFLMGKEKAMLSAYTRKTQEIADFRKNYEPVDQMFAPHRDALKERGLTPASTIQAWYDVEKALMDGRGIQVIQGIADGYGLDKASIIAALGGAPSVDPNRTHGPTAAETPPPRVDAPQVALPPELTSKLDQMAQRVDGLFADREAQNAAQYRTREAQVMRDINEFANAKGADGKPLHPHFNDAQATMASLVEAARARGEDPPALNVLYETATWAVPEIREKILTAERQVEVDKANIAAREKAQKAKRAGSSVTGTPGTSQSYGSPGKRSLREEIVAAAEDSSRV